MWFKGGPGHPFGRYGRLGSSENVQSVTDVISTNNQYSSCRALSSVEVRFPVDVRNNEGGGNVAGYKSRPRL
jgi:putative methionine-R-sulfoxide reductase with GAF domain